MFSGGFAGVSWRKLMIGSVKRIMAKTSPAQFVRQVRQEISRISWAGRRETGLATLTVFIMATIAAIFFLLVDLLFSNVIQFVLGMFS